MHRFYSFAKIYSALSPFQLSHNELPDMFTMGNKQMRKAASISAAIGMAILVVAPSQAANHKVSHHRSHIIKSEPAAPHRVCDWIGPGGRAVYRCTTVEETKQSLLLMQDPPRPHCDWIGPGGRALYMCR
jgi:hypothetical protein